MSGVYHGGNTLGLMSAAAGGEGRPIEAQCHPGPRVAVGDAEAEAPTNKPQISAISAQVGDGSAGVFDYGSLVARRGSPLDRWSIGFEIDGFARAATRPVRPCVHPPFPQVFRGSHAVYSGSRSQAQADPVEPPVTRLFLGSHRVPCGHFGSPLGDRTDPFRSPTTYYAIG